MSFSGDYSRDRTSDSPLAVDLSMSGSESEEEPSGLSGRLGLPQAWLGMSGYLVAGIVLGLVLILALSIGRGGEAAAAGPPPVPAVVDNIVRLHARDIGDSCWRGYEKLGPARLTVALEVTPEGKIRYAAASGETPAMRGCVEAHVMAWEFLPQAQAQPMALPIEVDRR